MRKLGKWRDELLIKFEMNEEKENVFFKIPLEMIRSNFSRVSC